MLTMPWRSGWTVQWYTGKTTTRRLKNGTERTIRWKESFDSTDKAKVEAKKKELEEQGFEIVGVYKCIF